MSSQAVTVFFSYSHADEDLRDELAKHLDALKQNSIISDWHDRQIAPGGNWDRQIKDNLNSAQIILLLVSSDFISSEYCKDVEIKRAMERHAAGEACVIPIILRKCFWNIMPFGKLQALPKNGIPVVDASTWPTLDDAFYDVTEGIYKVTQSFSQTKEPTASISANPVHEAEQLPKGNAEPREAIDETAQAQYRKRVKEYLLDRELTTFHEIRLGIFQNQLKLSKTEAQRIMAEELAPIKQAKETYKDALSQLIEAGHDPVDEETRQGLVQIQQELGITQAQVTAIEQPILEAAEYKFEVLGSEHNINYTQLRDLLKEGNWQAADKKTYEVMLRALGKEPGQYFSQDELINFPCQDLLTIDRLWVKYSNGHFGFSVQKKIYVECGATLDGKYPGDKIWREFADRIGWRVDGRYLEYSSLTFKTSATLGHLPGVVWGIRRARVSYERPRWLTGLSSYVFSRIQTCKV